MFVDRTQDGAIKGIFACQQYEGQEEVADDSTEVAAFVEAFANPPQPTPEQTLENLGLSVADLKQLLGLSK